jgi:hypothetical protein
MGIFLELHFDKKTNGKQTKAIDSRQIQIFDTHLTQKCCIILEVSILLHLVKFIMFKFM